MNVNLENLDKIEDILKIVQQVQINQVSQVEKRWLSTQELSEYIPYSKETINKKVQNETFICGVHFYQKEKIRMFDKLKIDEWIVSNTITSNNIEYTNNQDIINKMMNTIKAS